MITVLKHFLPVVTSLIGSIYVAHSESGDDSIYNLSRPTTKPNYPFYFFKKIKKINFFSCHFHEEKKKSIFFSPWDFSKEKHFLEPFKKNSLAVKKHRIFQSRF